MMTYISASDVFYNQFDQSRIKDKIVLIGSSAQGIFDLTKTPSNKIIPGVEVHATIIDNILSNDFLITNHITKLIENIILILSLILVIIFTSYIRPAFFNFIFCSSDCYFIFCKFNYVQSKLFCGCL